MLLDLFSLLLKLSGLSSFFGGLFHDHKMKEEGKIEQDLQVDEKELSDVQKANDFESRVSSDPNYAADVLRIVNKPTSSE